MKGVGTMNQQKTGGFLKRLRRERGLTQEQLAEQFQVSSRTISRWETGSNMPDVGMLMELAVFYDVDIREIIDGEKKRGITDQETKETLLKVAEYATEGEKQTQSRMVYVALGVAVTLFFCTLLFSTEATGLLYGIVPEDVCYYIMAVVYGAAFFLMVFYLRVLPFREKPSWEPGRSVCAAVVSKEVKSGTHYSGRSQVGYSFVVNFLTEDGRTLELYAYEIEFGSLREGMRGILTYRGRYFVSFLENTEIADSQ